MMEYKYVIQDAKTGLYSIHSSDETLDRYVLSDSAKITIKDNEYYVIRRALDNCIGIANDLVKK
jgi:hypothetical protein